MTSKISFYFAILVLVASTLALPSTLFRGTTNGSLEITSTLTCDCIRAFYTVGNVTLFIQSGLHNKRLNHTNVKQEIVSSIYYIQEVQEMRKLTELSIPAEYIYERQVKDIDKLIIASASDLAETFKKTEGLPLHQLISVYDGMIDDIYSHIYHLDFNHARTSVFYHASIVHAFQRLSQEVPPDQVCPAYKAYKYRGFFVCKQEYQKYLSLAVESSLFPRKSDDYMNDTWSDLGKTLIIKSQQESNKGTTKRSLEDLNEVFKAFARWRACGAPDCKVPACQDVKFDFGWNILGTDWGCCGDYPKCCYLAENTCLVHDVVCTCCTFKYFCVSEFCVPDPWCSRN